MATSVVELSIDDIADVRAYERERDEFRAHVIALKKKRRIHVGAFHTLLFENRDTIRFQIQEMSRAEKISTDEGIQMELDIYNPLISRPGRLCATLFLELTSEEQLREWLPKLVGVERSYELHLGAGDDFRSIRAQVDPGQEETLTRDDTTAAVNYVFWDLTADDTAALADGPATLVCTHPAYLEEAGLTDLNRESLMGDLL